MLLFPYYVISKTDRKYIDSSILVPTVDSLPVYTATPLFIPPQAQIVRIPLSEVLGYMCFGTWNTLHFPKLLHYTTGIMSHHQWDLGPHHIMRLVMPKCLHSMKRNDYRASSQFRFGTDLATNFIYWNNLKNSF